MHRMLALVLTLGLASAVAADEAAWIDLTAQGLAPWRAPTGEWLVAGDATPSADNPRRLTATPGQGTLVNGPTGRTPDLRTKEMYADVDVHVEFLIARGSNSGVKLMGLYEIQIIDKPVAKEGTGDSCGGIYPRAELKPRYHHIDKGVPPRTQAAREAGTWQSLDIVFQAPRFDAAGKKTGSARFVKVVLNGQVIHEDVEVTAPTGHAWRNPEVARGPLLLQGDHGPVAFRNVRIRPR